jgi:DNA polymerase delta subunit 1
MIYELWQSNEYTRRRIAIYCLKDAYLPLKLMDKLMAFYNLVEMCRVTCTPLNFILRRGQQIKVITILIVGRIPAS